MNSLEKAIQQFVEDEHDIGLAIRGHNGKKDYYNHASGLVRECKLGNYSTVDQFQCDRFEYICDEYGLNTKELKVELMRYQLR